MAKMRLLLLWFLWMFTVSPVTPNSQDRYNFFNVELLQRVNEENINNNVILSPSSVKVALISLVEGTGGQTRQELITALRLPPQESNIRRIAQNTLLPLKRSQNGTEIDVATRLWINPYLRISTDYSNILQQYYNTEIQQVNFADVNGVAQMINNWVRSVTRNNIDSIIQPGTLSSDTQLLLTSALYFKGKWLKSFARDATRTRCFQVPQQGCQDIPMMENTSKYRYAYIDFLDADVVEIPYSDGRTSMLVFLPSHETNDPYLQTLSKDLSYVPMKTLLARLRETELLLVIPRFSIETKLDLHSHVMRMGVMDLFSTRANFTGITSNEYLRVGSIIQDAKIEVDEEGTIAAAVSELTVIPLMGMGPSFIANKPFMFVIVDTSVGEMLFAGRFIRPETRNTHRIV